MVYPCLLSNKRDFLRHCSPPIIIYVQKCKKKILIHFITSGGKWNDGLIHQSQMMVLFLITTQVFHMMSPDPQVLFLLWLQDFLFYFFFLLRVFNNSLNTAMPLLMEHRLWFAVGLSDFSFQSCFLQKGACQLTATPISGWPHILCCPDTPEHDEWNLQNS